MLEHQVKRRKREDAQDVAVFPVILEALPQFIYRTRDPIVIGVRVTGSLIFSEYFFRWCFWAPSTFCSCFSFMKLRSCLPILVDGILKLGTPMCVPDKENLAIGRVTSIQVR